MRARGDVSYTASPPMSVEIGRLGHPEACRHLRLNWHPVEEWGAWAGTGRAILRVPWRPGASAVELTLCGTPGPGPSAPVRFMWNGRATTEVIPPGTFKAVAFPLPSDPARHDPDMRLDLGTGAVVPGSRPGRTTRAVGLGLVALRYVPAPSAGDAGTAPPTVDAPAIASERGEHSAEAR